MKTSILTTLITSILLLLSACSKDEPTQPRSATPPIVSYGTWHLDSSRVIETGLASIPWREEDTTQWTFRTDSILLYNKIYAGNGDSAVFDGGYLTTQMQLYIGGQLQHFIQQAVFTPSQYWSVVDTSSNHLVLDFHYQDQLQNLTRREYYHLIPS